MKKLMILAVMVLGFAATSFAYSLTGFVNAKNHSAINVEKTKISYSNVHKPTFAATDMIASVATGTIAATTKTYATHKTTDNLIWMAFTQNYSSIASFEIIINGVTVVANTVLDPYNYSDIDGTIPISVGDVITVNFYHVSENPDSNREIWFEYDDSPRTLISDALQNDSEITTTLTYIHQTNINGSSDVNLNISNWPF